MNISGVLAKNKRPNQTIFLRSEMPQLVGEVGTVVIDNALAYATRVGDLHRLTKGIFTLNSDYSKLELANKMRRPSYISLYSVLQEKGVVFQPYSSIFIVDGRSQEIVIESQTYIYRKIKDAILLNPLGVETVGEISRATAERAICDKIYLDGLEFFDNLRDINWDFMRRLNNEVYGNSKILNQFIERNK